MYLTFDIGTTSVKTVLYDKVGRLVHKVIKEYFLETPHLDWYEVNPEIYWKLVLEGFGEILKKSGVNPEAVKTISGCSQGETIILLDRDDRPIRPAIVWLDNRARAEVDELSRIIDRKTFYTTTGLVEMEPTWSVFKLLWLKKHEVENFKRINKIFLVEDYIVYRLTGRFVSSCSILTSTGLIDINKKHYWDETVSFLDVGGKLPEIIEEGSIVGPIKKEVAKNLGLRDEVVVVKGSMDQTTGAVGAGNISSGIITETTGTALVVAVTVKTPRYDSAVALPFQPHILQDFYLVLPYAQTAGIVYRWFRDQFAGDLFGKISDDKDSVFEALNREAESVPAGSDGLVILPYLAGASFPENDSRAKGVFYGVTLKHTRAHFARAIMESIGYMLKKILEYIERFGVRVEEIHSMGGGARSDVWLQIKSDICGYRFVRMKEEETSTLGAAIVAAVRVGDYPSIEDAVRKMVRKAGIFEPDPCKTGVYSSNYIVYKKLYDTLKNLFAENTGF